VIEPSVGQLNVRFIHCSGSEFVEYFIGRAATRVRSLFSKAARQAPCVIFIDEIDAIGKKRGFGFSNDEVTQTLNELLTQMDGLEKKKKGVVVVAATNLVDVLDPALVRPGRFDRIVRVELPDTQGRHDILRAHTRKFKLDDTIDLMAISELTKGACGAELASLTNEAAINSVKRGGESMSQSDLEEAINVHYRARRHHVTVGTPVQVSHDERNFLTQ
jgi:cell division protease FtsH